MLVHESFEFAVHGAAVAVGGVVEPKLESCIGCKGDGTDTEAVAVDFVGQTLCYFASKAFGKKERRPLPAQLIVVDRARRVEHEQHVARDGAWAR